MTTPALIHDVSDILLRDLQALADELALVPESALWTPLPGIINPIGTLSHHLCGNLRYFVGAALGGDGYHRDRDNEFSERGLTRDQLIAEVHATRDAVAAALGRLDSARLDDPMPDPPPQHRGRSIGYYLVQLCCHLSRHRGQLNYLRRILEGGAGTDGHTSRG